MENYLNANVDMLMFIERHQSLQMVQAFEPDEGITSTPISDNENSQSDFSTSDQGDSDLASLESENLEIGDLMFVAEGADVMHHHDSGSDSGEMTGSETELDLTEEQHELCDDESRDNELNDQQEELEAETRYVFPK